MKKILIFISFLLIGLVKVKAVTLEIKKDDIVKYYEYVPYKIKHNEAFLLSLENEYNITDRFYINNLAYLANKYSDEIVLSTIQKLIFEKINGYEINILDLNGNIIKTDNIEKELLEKLENYNVSNVLDGNYYEVNLYEPITLKGNNLISYFIDSSSAIENYGNTIKILGFNKTGLQEINFYNEINTLNNYVYAKTYTYKPFKIYVNVLGNEIKFQSSYNFNFAIYDMEDNYLGNFYITDQNVNFFYQKGQKLKLMDITENSIYEKIDDIYLNDESKVIILDSPLKKFNINIETFFMDYASKEQLDLAMTDVVVKNIDFKEIDKCQSYSCKLNLPGGIYYIVDNISKDTFYYEIWSDQDITLSRYLINGLISKKKLDDERLDFINNIYYFKDCIKDSRLIINNQIIDLYNKSKLWYINDLGIFYVINENEEDKEKNNLSVISIDIPDTEINFKLEIYFIKRRYYV